MYIYNNKPTSLITTFISTDLAPSLEHYTVQFFTPNQSKHKPSAAGAGSIRWKYKTCLTRVLSTQDRNNSNFQQPRPCADSGLYLELWEIPKHTVPGF